MAAGCRHRGGERHLRPTRPRSTPPADEPPSDKADQAHEIINFCEFWQRSSGHTPRLLVFDSTLTTHAEPDAIRAEAQIIAEDAAADLLEPPEQSDREALRDRVIAEMTAALVKVGDSYRAPDGVLYSLSDESAVDLRPHEGNLGPVNDPASRPIVEEVLRFEDLPLGSLGTRRAVVRWSDGTESEAINWYGEVLIGEGDLIGKTRQQLRSLHFRRDHDWLQS